MKFNILNLLSFVAIVALTAALVLSLRQNRSVVVNSSDHADTWDLLDYRVTSKWDEGQSPLPVSPISVLQIAERLNKCLNDQSDDTQLDDWRTQSINLSRLHFDHQWVYVVHLQGFELGHLGFERLESLRFLVLMDGSVVFDAKAYSAEIVNAVEKTAIAYVIHNGQYMPDANGG